MKYNTATRRLAKRQKIDACQDKVYYHIILEIVISMDFNRYGHSCTLHDVHLADEAVGDEMHAVLTIIFSYSLLLFHYHLVGPVMSQDVYDGISTLSLFFYSCLNFIEVTITDVMTKNRPGNFLDGRLNIFVEERLAADCNC